MENKLYELTAAQKLFNYVLTLCPQKQVLNIGTSFVIKEELDWNILCQSIYKAYNRCEAMRIRFVTLEDGSVKQYIAEEEKRPLEFFDFTNWKMEDMYQRLHEWTCIPFSREESPLNRIVMIRTPDGYNGLYYLVDHMTMDAQGLIVFLRDVIEIYCHMKYKVIPYPKEMASYIKQLQKDLEYENNSIRKQNDIDFFDKLLKKGEPIYCDIDGKKVLEEERKRRKNPQLRSYNAMNNSTEANITVFHLEKEPTERLIDYCNRNEISLYSLLYMGLRTYLQKVNESDDVSINAAVARRATLLEKRSGGTRVHAIPMRTIIDEDKTFLEGLEIVKNTQTLLFKHANMNSSDFFAMRKNAYNNMPGDTYEALSLTYQPATQKSNSGTVGQMDLGELNYRTRWYSNGVSSQGLYLTVMHRAEDNGLDFNFEYQTGKITAEKLEYLYYYLSKILFYAIENEEATIKEINKAV